MRNIYRKIRNIFFSDRPIRDNYCILKCNYCNKNNDISFCSICKEYFCQNCFDKNHEDKRDHIKMTSIEKNKMCIKHNKENKFYCFLCQEFFCDNDKEHNNHDYIKFNENEDIQNINNNLINIIKYNKLFSSTYESYKENYFHMKSVINLGEFYKEQDKMDLSELEWWSNKFKKARESEDKVKKKLNLSEEEKKLTLNINNEEYLKLLSKVMFNQLILIDLSNKKIKNIEFLDNMYLPFLEYLDMSDNKIEDIKPIAELNCKDLIEISLQNNNIKDIKPFLYSKFPKLQILRIEKNRIDSSNYEELLKKYDKKKKIIYYKVLKIKEFEEKYKWDISDKKDNNNRDIHKMKSLYLNGLNGKDDLIKDLYCIIPKNNKIERLRLDNNGIKDLSLLPRIPLPKLKSLDLSVNKIRNLKFLTRMETENLVMLFLNDNEINDISPLKRTIELGNIYGTKIFQKLEILSMNDNYFKIEMNQEFFNSRSIEIDN